MDNPPVERAGACEAVEGVAGCDVDSIEGPAPAQGQQVEASSTGCAPADAADQCEAQQAKPPQTLREFERAVRAMGFTRSQAAVIARQGFSAPTPREADDHDQLREALARLARTLKD